MTIFDEMERPPWRRYTCPACAIGRHAQCDHHMNDGAVDAEEFITVRCDCPCAGEVRTDERLIDLVARLRQDRDRLTADLAAAQEQVRGLQRLPDTPLRQAALALLDQLLNDEGEVAVFSRQTLTDAVGRFARYVVATDDAGNPGEAPFATSQRGAWRESLRASFSEEYAPSEDEDEDKDPLFPDDDGLTPTGPGGRVSAFPG